MTLVKDVVTLVLNMSNYLTVPLAIAGLQNYGDSNIVHQQSFGFNYAVSDHYLVLLMASFSKTVIMYRLLSPLRELLELSTMSRAGSLSSSVVLARCLSGLAWRPLASVAREALHRRVEVDVHSAEHTVHAEVLHQRTAW